MTTVEAFNKALKAVRQLHSAGIGVNVAPSKSRGDHAIVAKYGDKPDRVPPEMWVNVHFFPKTQQESDAIAKCAMLLGREGIFFDTGGMSGVRDWEMDWSFRYSGGYDPNYEVTHDTVTN